ncbi:MAG: DNA-binding NtrC family response regulator [Pseudohongiellaceae bacterium]|jgi:DNA-binding NtrC family response regulator
MNKKINIMVIDDEQAVVRSLNRLLRFHNFEASYFTDPREALLELNQRKYDMIISDAKMPGISGIEFLRIAIGLYPSIRNILISGFNDLNEIIEGFNAGVIHQYVPKPWNNESLIDLISAQLARIEEPLTADVAASGTSRGIAQSFQYPDQQTGLEGFKSQSYYMKQQQIVIGDAAKSNASVYIEGGSGSGKSMIARLIHQQSSRKKFRFLIINCAHLSKVGGEVQLFGETKRFGVSDEIEIPGLFSMADKGTLLIKELASLPLELHEKLSHALSMAVYSPVGSDKKIPFDIKVISTSKTNMEGVIQAGLFQKDLFLLLNKIPIKVRSLIDRPEDIEQFFRNNLIMVGVYADEFDPLVFDFLSHYKWPGNFRELDNVCKHISSVLKPDEKLLSASMLPDTLTEAVISEVEMQEDVNKLESLRKDNFEKILIQFSGKTDLAAKFLGVSRFSLWRKAKDFNISL